MSPSLTEQTPGLDKLQGLRDVAMRPVAYVRERPVMALSVLGGLVALGLGAWLAYRQWA